MENTMVIIAAPISDSFRNFLSTKYSLFDISSANDLLDYDLSSVEGIVTSNKLNLTSAVLQSFTSLVWIARLGSGMEIIDQQFCQEKNIHCFSSPKGISNSVAEHALGMLLSLMHRIHFSSQEVVDKKWIRETNRGLELETLTIGIVGFGHTGSAFAKKIVHLVSNVFVYDKYKSNFGSENIIEVDLEHIQTHADIISFHLPLNDETRHYYDESFLQKMKKPHYLINTSRGAIISTKTILDGLASQKIIGACLDVLEEEKNIAETLQQDNNLVQKLLEHNVIITPHIAGYSHQAIEKMSHELQVQLMTVIKT